jgi:hypothetical protein
MVSDQFFVRKIDLTPFSGDAIFGANARMREEAPRGGPGYTGGGGRPGMAGYRLEGPKAARMYEVILPKKLGYFGKVQEVLEDLFNEEAIRAIPFVQESIRWARAADANFDEEQWVRTLCRASRGYSIYEMDGRYLSPAGPVDERVLVIRFIFHNRGDEDPHTDFLSASLEIVNHLVAHRFAEELGVEEEIWFLEYASTRLAIWKKDDAIPDAEEPPR